MDIRLLHDLADDWPTAAVVRNFTVPSPAAGADWTFTCPGESTLGILSVSAQFVTSAVVATRVPIMQETDQSTTFWKLAPGAGQTASLTTFYSWLPLLGMIDVAITGNVSNVSTHPIYLSPGNTLGVATVARDVGDQWSAIVIQAVEVFHGHRQAERELFTRWLDRMTAYAAAAEGTL